jgi:hypothetical protein
VSNVLKVSLQATIYSLYDRGWSGRRIARELEICRETVGRYLLLARSQTQPFRPPTKSLGEGFSGPLVLPAGPPDTSEGPRPGGGFAPRLKRMLRLLLLLLIPSIPVQAVELLRDRHASQEYVFN